MDDVGKFLRINFTNNIAHITKGILEPSNQEEAYYESTTSEMYCNYKSVFKRLFEIDEFNEEICKFFQKMKYSIEIEEFSDGTTYIHVVDLTTMCIISETNDLLTTLNEFDLIRQKNLINNV